MIQNLKKSIYRIFNFRSKENNKIIEDLNNNLENCIKNKCLLKSDNVQNDKLVSNINKLLEAYNNNNKNIVKINDILNEIIGLDLIRDMIININSQTEFINSMVATSQELSATIDNMSSSIQVIADNSNNGQVVALNSIDKVNKSVEFIDTSFEDIETAITKMENIEKKVDEIRNVLNIIQEISDQTTLLSLNASIEAARVGEHGKGFMVVANEIKKLSEYTKESVRTINKSMIELQNETDESSLATKGIIKKLKIGKLEIDNIASLINDSVEFIKKIDEEISSIVATTEEQNAATSMFAEELTEVSSEAAKIENICRSVGNKVYSLSKNVENIRSQILKKEIDDLSIKEKIDIYKVDHLLWKWKIYNMLLGIDDIDAECASDYKECRLGKWYYREENKEILDNPIFKSIENPHINLHKKAKEAIYLYRNGNVDLSEKKLEEMDCISSDIIDLLDTFKTNI